MREFRIGDVVQFNEQHKWCGVIGMVNEVKPSKIMIGVQIPERGIAYVFCKSTDIEYIGRAILVPSDLGGEV